MCVKRVTRSELRTEYEAPPGRLGARHYVSLLCTADLSVRATLLYQLNLIITPAISNPSVQKQNARTYSVLLGLLPLRKRHRSCFLFPLQPFLSGCQFCDSVCFQWDLYFKMHPVFIVVSVTVILAYIKILLCQLTGFGEHIRELVVESENLYFVNSSQNPEIVTFVKYSENMCWCYILWVRRSVLVRHNWFYICIAFVTTVTTRSEMFLFRSLVVS